jgi:HEAT repeat protein
MQKDEFPGVRELAVKHLSDLIDGRSPRLDWRPELYALAQEAIESLRDLLKSPNGNVRRHAAQALVSLGGIVGAPALRQLLKDPSMDVRQGAAEALARVGSNEDVPALRTLLKDPDRNVRRAVAVVLGRVGSKDDAPALRALLDDPATDIRLVVVEALGRVGSKDDVPTLRALLKDPAEGVRRNASGALVRLAANEGAPALRQLLNEPDVEAGLVAAALGRVGNKNDVPALRTLLKHPAESVRLRVVEALARVGNMDDIPALRALLKDPSGMVRLAVAQALGKVGSKEDIPALRALLKDPALGVREGAAKALGRVGSKEDIPALRALLKDSAMGVQFAAAEALGRVGSKDDVPAFRALLKDPAGGVRLAAAEALRRMGSKEDIPALRALLRDREEAVRSKAAEALGRVGSKDDAPALRALLGDPLPDTRLVAAEALGRVGSEDDAAALRALLKDPAARLRLKAAKALEMIRATPPVVALTIAYKDTSRLDEFRWLARYWGGKSPETSEILCAYLARPNNEPQAPKSHEEARRVTQALISAWDELDDLSDLDSRWIREDIAKWWSWVITQPHKGWKWERKDKGLLQEVRDRLTGKEAAPGRGYASGIESVIDRFEFQFTEEVRTVIAFLVLNLLALVLYRLSLILGGLTKWLPFLVPLLSGIGVSLTDITSYYPQHTRPWLLTSLLLVEFAALIAGGLVSPRVLRQIAPVKPFNLVVPLALRLPRGRRRFFADYVQRVRQQTEYDRRQAADEQYTILPADVRDDRNVTATICANPADAILKFLSGADGPSGQVLVEATGGRGKSALIREVVSRALAAFEKDPGRKPLPVRLTGKGDSIETMVREVLGAMLILPELLTQHLEAGDFFLVLDGVSESGLSDKVLAGFLNGPYSATSVLLGSRPTSQFRQLIEGTPRWMTVEPRRLDEASLDRFIAHYGAKPLSAPVKVACRGAEGTYLPILVRMAMRTNSDRRAAVNVADIYREYFLQMFAAEFPDHKERLRLLNETGRWCLETYWKDGQRNRKYEGSDLQQVLLRAGVFVPAGGITIAKEVRFFHDSMQSYLTAYALSAEDEHGYAHLPRPAEDGDGAWDRRRVIFRVAGAELFVGAHSDIVLTEGSELFQMVLATFSDRAALRQFLRLELENWASAHHQDLRLADFKAALPKSVARKARTFSDNKELLMKAADVAFEEDRDSTTVDALGAIYGCLAPLVWKLKESEGKKSD